MGNLVTEPLVLTRLKELRLIHLHFINEATTEEFLGINPSVAWMQIHCQGTYMAGGKRSSCPWVVTKLLLSYMVAVITLPPALLPVIVTEVELHEVEK
jgi:hypothetical protein